MRTVEEALTAILAATYRLETEQVPLPRARGRVLAEDAIADSDVPPFANSAVDGYAVRAGETQGATQEDPVTLPVGGEIVAGMPPDAVLEPGTALKIMTGAPVPQGADAIIMVEDTRVENGQVAILAAAQTGQHIRPAGEEISRGAVGLPAGALLRPAEIGLLATLGYAQVMTTRPARVAVVSTGDEVVVVEAGVTPPPGKIRNSNAYALAALIEETGAILHSQTHLPDDPDATEAAFRTLTDSDHAPDVIVTSGGVSVGDRDYVKLTLEKLGRLELWRVAMKPGKPLAFGRIGKTLFFGLPGNPVSTQVTFELFVRPALWKMAGRSDDKLARPRIAARLLEALSHTPGRREYVRAVTTTEGGEWVTRPAGAQGSGMGSSLTRANSLLIVPLESAGLEAGAQVEVLLLP